MVTEPNRQAILIGASEFLPTEFLLPALRCPENDVQGLAEVLTSPEYGLFDVRLLSVNQPHHFVMREVNRVFKQSARQDQLLVYYSGHGMLDGEGHLHLAMTDTEMDTLEATSMPFAFLRKLINNHHCKQAALILDCCYSGDAAKDLLKGGVNHELRQMRGVYVLTASSPLHTAREMEGDRYSLLTKHILDGITSGGADYDDNGYVSIKDLFNYVKERVPKEAPQYPTEHEIDVRGDELYIARSFKVFPAERLRALKQRIIQVEGYLPKEIFLQAYDVVTRNEARKDKEFLALLEGLCEERIGVGEFSDLWLNTSLKRESEVEPSEVPRKRSDPQIPLPAEPNFRRFEFETITLDEEGNETNRRILQGDSFGEDLGDGVILEMVKIPTGTFLMGSPEWESQRSPDEGPQHEVTVAQFLLGRFAVTREQWRQVARMQKVEIDLHIDPSYFKQSWRQPVEQVTWGGAEEFCARLARKTGGEYRLPTESEWEYACRAGTTTPFAFGLTTTSRVVNGNCWFGSRGYRGQTVEVGSLKFANAFGLYDMHGNVREWCEDVYHDSYDLAPGDGSAWILGGEHSFRVLRGCSWSPLGSDCRSASRTRSHRDNAKYDIGFRVACSPRAR